VSGNRGHDSAAITIADLLEAVDQRFASLHGARAVARSS